MAMTAPPVSDRKRVKVYELKDNDWFDRGTGFCTGSLVNVSCTMQTRRDPIGKLCADAALIQEEARIHVQSEDDPDRTLLETKITKDDGYQKQQGTYTFYLTLPAFPADCHIYRYTHCVD